MSALVGEQGAYTPCHGLAAVQPVDPLGALVGSTGAYVATQVEAGAQPAEPVGAIVGSEGGFTPGACCVDEWRRTVAPTGVTLATASGALLGASDLGPDWDVDLISLKSLVEVEVDNTAWVTTIEIPFLGSGGQQGSAQAKLPFTAPNQIGTTKTMRFEIRAMPDNDGVFDDFALRVIFNPIGFSATGPGGPFGGGATIGSGLGGLGGAPYVTINQRGVSTNVQNSSEIAFTSSVWDLFDYYTITTPTPISPSFWGVGGEYEVSVRSEIIGPNTVTTATITNLLTLGAYSSVLTLTSAVSLPEYDAPTLTGPEVAILRSFEAQTNPGSPPWTIAVECIEIPEF